MQAAWLQLTDSSSAGVVAAELAFLRAQLAELPALEQLDAAQGFRAGPDPSDQPEAADAPQRCPADANGAGSLTGGAASGAGTSGGRPAAERGCGRQARVQRASGAGTGLGVAGGHAGGPGAFAEGFRVSGTLQGAPASAPPAATQGQGAWHAGDSGADGNGVLNGGVGVTAVSPTT